tara:strand:- start:809 stop:1396 length:588 start_codon:yes stop_codon:yes gene_type:complete
MGQKKRQRATHRGFGEPARRVSTDEVEQGKTRPPDLAEPGTGSAEVTEPDIPTPAVPRENSLALDIEHIHETGSPALFTGPWRAIEVWTRNRIYGVDGAMICRSVVDRASGGSLAEHPAPGARLLGGQHRDESGRILWVAHPLPARGGAAVFAEGIGKRLKVSETSDVTRVVVRQRVVSVAPDAPPPRWDEVTGD